MTAATRPRLILFPGLGADPRMFAEQRAALPHIETPAWIPHVPGESLRAYAARFADTLNIQEPAILGGVSMGGMIALEMARLVPTRCVLLIASTRAMGAVNPLLRIVERSSRLLPSWLIDHARVLAPLFVGRGSRLPWPRRRLLATMARELPVEFLRWAARAAIEWPGVAPPQPGSPVHAIHGDRDWVFLLKRVDPRPGEIIPGGIHVLNFSHPAEVNAFVARHMD